MLTWVRRVPADPEPCQRWALTSRLRGWSAGTPVTLGPGHLTSSLCRMSPEREQELSRGLHVQCQENCSPRGTCCSGGALCP